MFIEQWTGKTWTKHMWLISQACGGLFIAASAATIVLKALGYRTGLAIFLLQVAFLATIYPRYSVDAYKIWRREGGVVFDTLLAILFAVSSFFVFELDTAFMWFSAALQFVGMSYADAILPVLLRFDDWNSHMIIVFIAPIMYLFLRVAFEIELLGPVSSEVVLFTIDGKSLTLLGLSSSFLDIIVVRMFQGSWGVFRTPYALTHARARAFLVDERVEASST